MLSTSPRRVAVVVHPTRPVDEALRTLGRWAGLHGIDVVQLEVDGVQREVAAPGKAQPGDLVVALGGDGTVLSALRAAAASDAPVLGVACGSLVALRTTAGTSACAGLSYQPSRRIAFPESRPAQPSLGQWPRKRKRGILSRFAT